MTDDQPDPLTQDLTEGGHPYGYTNEEMAPHLAEVHQVMVNLPSVFALEEIHLALHHRGADHTHTRTETGALALHVQT